MKFPGWGGFVPVFWWMDIDLVSLKASAMFSSVFWSPYGFGMALGSLSINVQSYIPILLKMWCGASGTEVYWPWP